MVYTQEQIQEKFNSIIDLITAGDSLRSCLSHMGISSATFYQWLDVSEERQKQYARACEDRADKIFDEILEIADKQDADVLTDQEGNEQVQHNVIARSRLQVDARKWALSKMNPKKYGDKIDHTTAGEKLPSNTPPTIVFKNISGE